MIGCRDSFFSCHLYFFPYSHLSSYTFFVCFFILFHFCCFHSRLLGKTLVHEFLISYSHTEWYLLFFAIHDRNGRRVACQNLTIILISKKAWLCKAGIERLTPYQSEDPSPTIPTHRMKEEKGDKKGASS